MASGASVLFGFRELSRGGTKSLRRSTLKAACKVHVMAKKS